MTMSPAERGSLHDQLDELLKKAAEATHRAFEEGRRPSECGVVGSLLDQANAIRRTLGLVAEP